MQKGLLNNEYILIISIKSSIICAKEMFMLFLVINVSKQIMFLLLKLFSFIYKQYHMEFKAL